MLVYLDNCVLNRPFDDQEQLRIKKETEAVQLIREMAEAALIKLVWSYVLEFENSRNPVTTRSDGVLSWKNLSLIEIGPSVQIDSIAIKLRLRGLKEFDALHLACAIESKSGYFVTTDDAILNRSKTIKELRVLGPVDFVKEVKENEK